MNKIFILILKALQQIHAENILILATWFGKDFDDKTFDKLNEAFDKIMKEAEDASNNK